MIFGQASFRRGPDLNKYILLIFYQEKLRNNQVKDCENFIYNIIYEQITGIDLVPKYANYLLITYYIIWVNMGLSKRYSYLNYIHIHIHI